MNTNTITHFRKKQLAVGLSTAIMMSFSMGALSAAVEENPVSINISGQSLGKAIIELSKETGVQIVLDKTISASDVNVHPVIGEYKLTDALNAMLRGTDLEYYFASEDAILIRQKESSDSSSNSKGDEEESEEKKGVDEEIVVTGSRLITDPGKMTRQVTILDREEIERSGATRLDEFLRRLPQNVNAPSNLGSGFDGGGSPQDFFGGQFGMGANVFAGTSANLRGLGSQYTLILIDGRRPAKGGQFGGITDISNIPIERVNRIEILFDGAAAIYGADAVGGVINIITNREYEGTNVTLTASGTEDGGGTRYNFNIGHTFSWDSGSLTASASYQRQGAIDGSQRNLGLGLAEEFALDPAIPGNIAGGLNFSDPSRPVNPLMYVRDVNGDGDTLDAGDDERLTGIVEVQAMVEYFPGFSLPTTLRVDRGNIPTLGPNVTLLEPLPEDATALGYRAVTQAQLPEYNGQPITLYDIDDSGEVGPDAYVPFQGLSVAPKDETYSLNLALNQELSDSFSINASLSYTKTDKASATRNRARASTIRADSPYNPFGSSIRYAWVNEFPQESQVVDQKSISFNGGFDWDISDEWNLSFGVGYSESDNTSDTINQLRTSSPPFGEFQPNLGALLNGFYRQSGQTIDLGTHFNDPLLGFASGEELAEAVVIPLLTTVQNSTSLDADMTLSGTLFELPAGDARASLTLSHRKEETAASNTNGRFATSVFVGEPGEGFNFESLYDEEYGSTTQAIGAELSIPVVDDGAGLPFMDHFLLSFSGRLEDYENVEDKGTNWAGGFNWAVNDWMTVRFNRTYSLRVPEAIRSARGQDVIFRPGLQIVPFRGASGMDPNTVYDEDYPNFQISGGSDHLESEQSYGNALSFIFRPAFLDGLDIQLNLTENNTYDMIGNPGVGNFTIEDVSEASIASNPILYYADPANNPLHAEPVLYQGQPVFMQAGDLIWDRRSFNVGDSYTRGADAQVSYNFSTEIGDWLVTWRHQYMDVSEIIQSDVCVNDVCGYSGAVETGVPLDVVDTVDLSKFSSQSRSPLPRHRGSLDVNWNYRGLSVGLNTSYQSEVSVIRHLQPNIFSPFRGLVNIVREDTQPEQSVDMVMRYDFGAGDLFETPDWLSTTRLSLSVTGLYRKEQSVDTVELQTEYDDPTSTYNQLFNRYSINPRGRAFTLTLNSQF